jgi:type II secretory pathway pseudopilin PulG
MPYKKHKFSEAFTIAELLITLAIMALLLAAVATAFNASAINFKENENMYKAITAARNTLLLMTSQIRTGLVDPTDLSQTTCKLLCADGSNVTYRYNSSEKKLYLHNNSTNTDYLLCENVTGMTFQKDNNTPTGDIKSVQITITVESNNAQQTLSAAAVVRKVLN